MTFPTVDSTPRLSAAIQKMLDADSKLYVSPQQPTTFRRTPEVRCTDAPAQARYVPVHVDPSTSSDFPRRNFGSPATVNSAGKLGRQWIYQHAHTANSAKAIPFKDSELLTGSARTLAELRENRRKEVMGAIAARNAANQQAVTTRPPVVPVKRDISSLVNPSIGAGHPTDLKRPLTPGSLTSSDDSLDGKVLDSRQQTAITKSGPNPFKIAKNNESVNPKLPYPPVNVALPFEIGPVRPDGHPTKHVEPATRRYADASSQTEASNGHVTVTYEYHGLVNSGRIGHFQDSSLQSGRPLDSWWDSLFDSRVRVY